MTFKQLKSADARPYRILILVTIAALFSLVPAARLLAILYKGAL